MTAKAIAELAESDIQTALLINAPVLAARITGRALRLIVTHGNVIPDETELRPVPLWSGMRVMS